MHIRRRLCLVVVCLLLSGGAAYYQAQDVPEMASVTKAFLASLTPQQRAKAQFSFDSPERFNWNFVPIDRKGLPFKEIQDSQKPLMFRMMVAAMGTKGRTKAQTIMELEKVLGRDSELYYFSIFGDPAPNETWGWRFEGHHVAFNVTMDKGKFVSATPTFLGANPATVMDGPLKGTRVLEREEDLARQFLWSLDQMQRKTAIINVSAPSDIITSNSRQAQLINPVGLAASTLNPRQKEMLFALIKEYAERTTGQNSQAVMTDLAKLSLDQLHFAWAGSQDPGQPHYYRVQTPTFLIEYDNTQNNANHIHSVWRDLKNDFGVDVLREHYKAAHL